MQTQTETPVLQFDGGRTAPTDGFQLACEPMTKIPYSYQLAAVETILHFRRVILGLQPGMGKTLCMQAVAADEALWGRRSLFIVPPSLSVSPWDEEFRLDYPHLNVQIVTGTKPGELPADADIVIMPDSIVSSRVEDIKDWGPHCLFGDEAHRFKSPDSKRTKAMIEVGDLIPDDGIVVMGTGTLSVNHAGDVYHPLRITGEDNAKAVSYGPTWKDFLEVHCETMLAWKKLVVTGCQDVEFLRKKLMASCMINIPRDEVLDLPDRTFSHIDLTLSQSSKGYKEYAFAQKNFLDWVMDNFGEESMERASKAEAMVKLMRLWELDGKAKAPATVEYITNLVEQDEPVVCMAWHSTVLDALVDGLRSNGLAVGAIRGGMDSVAKAQIVDMFQAGQLDVVVGQIEAAGTGLTLTAARHLVFAQLPWSPAAYGQASDRIYRIGQTKTVQIHMLCGHVAGQPMVSTKMWDVLVSKAKVTDAVNNGKPSTIDTSAVISEVLSSYGF